MVPAGTSLPAPGVRLLRAAVSCTPGIELRFDLDAGKGCVNGDVARKILYVLRNDEAVSVRLEPVISVFWLILSQPQLRTPSAEGHVDAQVRGRLPVEMLVELLSARLGQSNHESSL
jgi:hypothetical protein